MAASVFRLPASTSLNVEQTLNSALQLDLQDVLVIGYDQDGALVVRSSRMTCAEATFLAEKARMWALSGGNP